MTFSRTQVPPRQPLLPWGGEHFYALLHHLYKMVGKEDIFFTQGTCSDNNDCALPGYHICVPNCLER